MSPDQKKRHGALTAELVKVKNSNAWARGDPAANDRLVEIRKELAAIANTPTSARERIERRALKGPEEVIPVEKA